MGGGGSKQVDRKSPGRGDDEFLVELTSCGEENGETRTENLLKIRAEIVRSQAGRQITKWPFTEVNFFQIF